MSSLYLIWLRLVTRPYITDDESNRVSIALQRYRDGEIGTRGAADIAGCSIQEMMTHAHERGVISNDDEEELVEDIEALE